jgi:DNA-binding FrmR family transcriptional regulator
MADHAETDEAIVEDVAKRLARIAGHAASLCRMWDEGRECEQMLTQISAVRAGLDQAAKVIYQQHIGHCVRDAIESGEPDKAVEELGQALDRIV